MSRVMSFRDLRLIPELSEYSEVELLCPSKDAMVAKYLGGLGFATAAAVQYVPNNHRDMQGGVGVGFRAVGEISLDSDFLKSRLSTMEDRILAAYATDPSLAREMAQMMNVGVSFTGVDDGGEENFPEEHTEPDYAGVSAQIKTLEDVRDYVRGPAYNAAGALKTYTEVGAING